MSKATDFFGSTGGGILGVTPAVLQDKYYTARSDQLIAGNPDGNGDGIAPKAYNAAWEYYDTDGTLLWSKLMTDINAAADSMIGVCWYSATSVMFVAADDATNTLYFREVTVATGVIEGASADVVVTNITASANEYAIGVFHKSDLTGFYISSYNYVYEVNTSFVLQNSYLIGVETGGFINSDLVAFQLLSDTNSYSDGSVGKFNDISNYATAALSYYKTATELGINPLSATNQQHITYFDGSVAILGQSSIQADLSNYDTTMGDVATKIGAIS